MYISLYNMDSTITVTNLEDYFTSNNIPIKKNDKPSNGIVINFNGINTDPNFRIESGSDTYKGKINTLIASDEFKNKFNTGMPLTNAALALNTQKISELITNGANINYQNTSGDTILMTLIKNFKDNNDQNQLQNLQNTIELLIEKKIDLTIKNTADKNTMDVVNDSTNQKIIKILQDIFGKQLIAAVISNNLLEVNNLIANYSLDINYKDSTGRTAISYASELGFINIVNQLIEPADLNILDNRFYTPLLYAIEKGATVSINSALSNANYLNTAKILIDNKKTDLTIKISSSKVFYMEYINNISNIPQSLVSYKAEIKSYLNNSLKSRLSDVATQEFDIIKFTSLFEASADMRYDNGHYVLLLCINTLILPPINTNIIEYLIGKEQFNKNDALIATHNAITMCDSNNNNCKNKVDALKKIKSLLQDAMGERLIDAIQNHNIERANEFIGWDANINYQNKYKRTALFYAVLTNDLPDNLTQSLLEQTTSNQLNLQDKEQSTVLMHALFHKKSINVIQMLIDKKPDLTLKNYLSKNAFSYAKDRGDQNIIKIFNKTLGEQLIEATKNNNIQQVKKLFDAGADINTFIAGDNVNIITGLRDDRSALFYATSFEMFELLANNNGKDLLDINVKDSDNITLLMIYAFNTNKQIVQYLIDKNANLTLKDTDHLYVLSYAKAGFNVASEELKQKHQEMIDLIQTTLNTQFFEFVSKNYQPDVSLDRMKALLDTGANINYQDPTNNMTALIYASKARFTDIVRELVTRKNIELNIIDKDERTALIYSCIHNNKDAANILITDLKTDLNIQDEFGRTGLMCAANLRDNNGLAIVNLFIATLARENTESKVNLNLKDKDGGGNTALDLATNANNQKIMDILIANGAIRNQGKLM